jgi:DNA-binding NarL/FixJ family response regulator
LVDEYRSSIVLFASALRPEYQDLMSHIKVARSRAVVIAENGEPANSFIAHDIRGAVYRNTDGKELVECVHRVINGYRSVQGPVEAIGRLTPKEMKIVALLVQGCKNKEIALRLDTTEQVIKNYLRRVYDKTGVSDRVELALLTTHDRYWQPRPRPAASSTNGLEDDIGCDRSRLGLATSVNSPG